MYIVLIVVGNGYELDGKWVGVVLVVDFIIGKVLSNIGFGLIFGILNGM